MGDMAEIFNAMRAHNKERKARNLLTAQQFKELFTIHTEWHWGCILNGLKLDYWPSTNKWQWRGKIYNGTAQDLQNFIAKRAEP